MGSDNTTPLLSENQIWKHISSRTYVLVQKVGLLGIAYCVIVEKKANGQWVVTPWLVAIPGRKFFDLGNRGFRYECTKNGRRMSVASIGDYGKYVPRNKHIGAAHS